MKRDFDSIDILVNNAAIAFKGSDPTPFAQQAWPTINTNYFGTLRLTEGLLPLIEKSTRSPRIVNVASSAGHLRILTSKVPAQWTLWMNNILWWILCMHAWMKIRMYECIWWREASDWRTAFQELVQKFLSPILRVSDISDLMNPFVRDVQGGSHSQRGWPNTCYGTSKLGVIALTRVMARDLAV